MADPKRKTTNQTLGRGRILFKKLGDSGFRYIGNTPSFGLTVTSETLKHYNSDSGVKVQDKEIVVQTEYQGSLVTDNVNHENMAMLLLGSAATVAVGSGTAVTATFNDVVLGNVFDLGKRNVSSVVIAGKVLGTDYTVDAVNGLVTIPETSTIAAGSDVTVTFNNAAYSYDKTVAAGTAVEGAVMFVSNNPEGDDNVYLIPDVKMTPNGEFAIKAEEWQQLSFNLAISVPDNGDPAITINGRPYTP